MEAYSSSPLVADHLPKNHPVVTRDYSLFTPAISEMVNTVARWIDDQVDGATVYGPSRFGKSSAVDHWLQALLSRRSGGHIPMVVWSHTDSGSSTSVGRFHSHLLHAGGPEAPRNPLDRHPIWGGATNPDAGDTASREPDFNTGGSSSAAF